MVLVAPTGALHTEVIAAWRYRVLEVSARLALVKPFRLEGRGAVRPRVCGWCALRRCCDGDSCDSWAGRGLKCRRCRRCRKCRGRRRVRFRFSAAPNQCPKRHRTSPAIKSGCNNTSFRLPSTASCMRSASAKSKRTWDSIPWLKELRKSSQIYTQWQCEVR
jgi:hypothetical protein